MISVWPFSSQRWSRDFGRRSGELESCCTHCYATVRRVRHTVSPRPERSHSRRAENSTTSPSSSGFWSMPRAALLFFFFSPLCPLLSWIPNRALQTPQPLEGAIPISWSILLWWMWAVCGLHCMLWPRVLLLYFMSVHLLFCCCLLLMGCICHVLI